MRLSKAVVCGGLILAGTAQANAGSVDAKLLDMLKANGSISAAQHAELSADLAREAREEKRAAKDVVKEKDFVAFRQAAGWAESTRLTGDMRVRQETIDVDGEPDFTGSRDKDRQRIRARLGAFTKVNSEVETGIQVASGNGADRRSTNENMDNYFDKKAVWLDLAYISYVPAAVPGLKTFAGKMKQPWMSMGDVIWDGDINPEGFAAGYTKKNGTTTFFGSGGYYMLKDAVDSEGFEIEQRPRPLPGAGRRCVRRDRRRALDPRRQRLRLQQRQVRLDLVVPCQRQHHRPVRPGRNLHPARRDRPAAAAVALRSVRAELRGARLPRPRSTTATRTPRTCSACAPTSRASRSTTTTATSRPTRSWVASRIPISPWVSRTPAVTS